MNFEFSGTASAGTDGTVEQPAESHGLGTAADSSLAASATVQRKPKKKKKKDEPEKGLIVSTSRKEVTIRSPKDVNDEVLVDFAVFLKLLAYLSRPDQVDADREVAFRPVRGLYLEAALPEHYRYS